MTVVERKVGDSKKPVHVDSIKPVEGTYRDGRKHTSFLGKGSVHGRPGPVNIFIKPEHVTQGGYVMSDGRMKQVSPGEYGLTKQVARKTLLNHNRYKKKGFDVGESTLGEEYRSSFDNEISHKQQNSQRKKSTATSQKIDFDYYSNQIKKFQKKQK